MSEYVERLVPSIEAILRSADLDKVSAKSVRKALIAQGVDEAGIRANKADLDKRIETIYLSLPVPEPEDGDAEGEDLNSRSKDAKLELNGSQSIPATSPQVALQKAASSKRSESPRKNKVVKEDTDEAFARRLQAELNAADGGRRSRGTANGKSGKKKVVASSSGKRKSAAMIGSDDDSEVEDEDEDEDGAVVKKTKKKKSSTGDGSTRGGAFNAPMILSEPLAALTGETHLSRPGTVKAIWKHIKANDLQDPSDKRYIRCDDAMKKVFGVERVHMFSMNKSLSQHLFNPNEIVQ